MNFNLAIAAEVRRARRAGAACGLSGLRNRTTGEGKNLPGGAARGIADLSAYRCNVPSDASRLSLTFPNSLQERKGANDLGPFALLLPAATCNCYSKIRIGYLSLRLS